MLPHHPAQHRDSKFQLLILRHLHRTPWRAHQAKMVRILVMGQLYQLLQTGPAPHSNEVGGEVMLPAVQHQVLLFRRLCLSQRNLLGQPGRPHRYRKRALRLLRQPRPPQRVAKPRNSLLLMRPLNPTRRLPRALRARPMCWISVQYSKSWPPVPLALLHRQKIPPSTIPRCSISTEAREDVSFARRRKLVWVTLPKKSSRTMPSPPTTSLEAAALR